MKILGNKPFITRLVYLTEFISFAVALGAVVLRYIFQEVYKNNLSEHLKVSSNRTFPPEYIDFLFSRSVLGALITIIVGYTIHAGCLAKITQYPWLLFIIVLTSIAMLFSFSTLFLNFLTAVALILLVAVILMLSAARKENSGSLLYALVIVLLSPVILFPVYMAIVGTITENVHDFWTYAGFWSI